MRLGHAHAERERDQDLSDFAESRYDYSISHVFFAVFTIYLSSEGYCLYYVCLHRGCSSRSFRRGSARCRNGNFLHTNND